MNSQPWTAHIVPPDLWTVNLSTAPAPTRLKIYALRLAIVAVKEFQRDQLALRAMGLVYTSLLSFVPFLAVTFSVLKAFEVHQSLEPVLARVLEPLGAQGAELSQHVILFVNNLKVGVLGTVGIAGLFFTVISLLGQIEDALNQIWSARRARTLARKFTDYLSVILVGPVLVFSAFALTASAQSYWLVQWVLQQTALEWIMVALTRVMPFLFLCTAFTFFYKFLPCTQVRFSSALIGGATAGLLWQTAGIGFAAFIANSARYTAIYSGFAVVILFLIWLYVGWFVVLAGGEVAYLSQRGFAALVRSAPGQRFGVARVRAALQMFIAIARRTLAQQPPWKENELATEMNIRVTELEELIDEGVRRGFLLRTAEPKGVTLARLPEHITIPDLFTFVDYSEPGAVATLVEKEDPVSWVLYHRNQIIQQAFADLTLRSLASETPITDSAVERASASARLQSVKENTP
ncbi:MAG: YihY/virulence factor BrkB family protein [Candidatus Binatia bacterium]